MRAEGREDRALLRRILGQGSLCPYQLGVFVCLRNKGQVNQLPSAFFQIKYESIVRRVWAEEGGVLVQ